MNLIYVYFAIGLVVAVYIVLRSWIADPEMPEGIEWAILGFSLMLAVCLWPFLVWALVESEL